MSSLKQRLSITIRGAIQGVGFRPFIYRLAIELRLVGWVKNSALVGLRQQTQFEGQAAMELEFAIAEFNTEEYYALEILAARSPLIVDWLQWCQKF